jgi:hypothetical protein
MDGQDMQDNFHLFFILSILFIHVQTLGVEPVSNGVARYRAIRWSTPGASWEARW